MKLKHPIGTITCLVGVQPKVLAHMVKIKLNNHNVVVFLSLKDSIKDAQSSLQNTITWIKKKWKANMNGL